jgi:NitT/TauT family transport system permease protein
LILQRDFNLDMAGVFAILLLLSALGIGLHALMMALQRRVVFWVDHRGDRVVGA